MTTPIISMWYIRLYPSPIAFFTYAYFEHMYASGELHKLATATSFKDLLSLTSSSSSSSSVKKTIVRWIGEKGSYLLYLLHYFFLTVVILYLKHPQPKKREVRETSNTFTYNVCQQQQQQQQHKHKQQVTQKEGIRFIYPSIVVASGSCCISIAIIQRYRMEKDDDNPDRQHEERVRVSSAGTAKPTRREDTRDTRSNQHSSYSVDHVDSNDNNTMCHPTDQREQQQYTPSIHRPSLSRSSSRNNSNSLSVEEMEQIVATARTSSSFQERTLAMEDLHGVASASSSSTTKSASSSDPSSVRRIRRLCLDVMNHKLSAVRTVDERLAQHQHQHQAGTTRLDDHGLQWAFLEACGASIRIPEGVTEISQCNPIIDDAIDRLIRYVSLQNQHAVVPPASSSSSSSSAAAAATTRGGGVDHLMILQSGCFQLLPQPDQAGRLIVGIFPTLLPHQSSRTSLVSHRKKEFLVPLG
jgi:hypothetical protein